MKIGRITTHFVPSAFAQFNIEILRYNWEKEADELVEYISKDSIINVDSHWYHFGHRTEKIEHWLLLPETIKIWLACD